MIACNICGNEKFGAGPGGRMSLTGRPPRCVKCQALERHRVYRKVFERLVDNSFKKFNFLQFSADSTVEPSWFASHEVSIYEGNNSLDLQKIDRSSCQYDIVMCNHVLEHVADDNAALTELLRITKHDGFVFLTVPSPLSQERTQDWGYPKEEQHGHYRIYGSDFAKKLIENLPQNWILSKIEIDDATDSEDIIFFLGKNMTGYKRILKSVANVEIIQKCNISHS